MQAIRIIAASSRIVRWPIAPRGAARGAWRERTALLVGVRCHNGTTGLGEAAPLPGVSSDTLDDARRAYDEFAAVLPIAITCAADAAAIAHRVTSSAASRFAIETALLIALAQSQLTSIAALLDPDPLNELKVAPVVGDVADAQRAVARGYRCLKLKANSPDIVFQVARAVPSARLRVDANRSWPWAETKAWLQQLATLPIDYVEEPCADAHHLLTEDLPCRIAFDESVASLGRADLERALRHPSLAALVLKPTVLGGFARCLELATLAQRNGVAPIVSHTLEGPIGTFACVELARAIGADVPVGLAAHPALEGFWASSDHQDLPVGLARDPIVDHVDMD